MWLTSTSTVPWWALRTDEATCMLHLNKPFRGCDSSGGAGYTTYTCHGATTSGLSPEVQRSCQYFTNHVAEQKKILDARCNNITRSTRITPKQHYMGPRSFRGGAGEDVDEWLMHCNRMSQYDQWASITKLDTIMLFLTETITIW